MRSAMPWNGSEIELLPSRSFILSKPSRTPSPPSWKLARTSPLTSSFLASNCPASRAWSRAVPAAQDLLPDLHHREYPLRRGGLDNIQRRLTQACREQVSFSAFLDKTDYFHTALKRPVFTGWRSLTSAIFSSMLRTNPLRPSMRNGLSLHAREAGPCDVLLPDRWFKTGEA